MTTIAISVKLRSLAPLKSKLKGLVEKIY